MREDKTMRILLIEDDKVTATLIKKPLKDAGYVIDHVTTAAKGMTSISENTNVYSLIIVNSMLPDKDGKELCEQIRNQGTATPIMFISTEDEENHIIQCLDAGADDYLIKPFSTELFMARARAMLRRKDKTITQELSCGKLVLLPDTKTVTYDGKNLYTSALQFRLLHLFLLHQGKVISRQEIVDKVWGYAGDDLSSNAVDVHVMQLRKLLREASGKEFIETSRGFGYMLNCQ